MGLALTADILTSSRLVIAFALPAVVGTKTLDWSAALVTVAWATDFLDGQAARATDQPTRLKEWDLRVDITVAAGILVGLGIGGYTPWWLVVSTVVVLGGLSIVYENPSPAMLMVGFIYARYLWLLIDAQAMLWWLPFLAIGFLAILDWRRFTRLILPAFFKGAAALLRRERTGLPPVIDNWAAHHPGDNQDRSQ